MGQSTLVGRMNQRLTNQPLPNGTHFTISIQIASSYSSQTNPSAAMNLRLLFILGIAFVQTCCVLPIPHCRVHVHGIDGKVIDSKTHAPIQKAEVASTTANHPFAVTATDGRFRIKPIYGWHGAYLFGPISYSLLPHFDMAYWRAPIRISAAGYRPAEFGAPHLIRDGLQEFPLDPK